MAKPNPFQVIGIDPSLLRGKNNTQIKRLVQLVGRAVMQVEHPDVGGNDARFAAVKNALSELKDDEKFLTFKERYLLPPKTQLANLRGELVRSVARSRRARGQLRSYFESLVNGVPSVLAPVGPAPGIVEKVRAVWTGAYCLF